MPCQPEPIFEQRDPNPWYVDFAAANEPKLRTHSFYNTGFFPSHGAWLEATLSENTAHKKLFRHGQQAPQLIVIWLGKDTGLHKKVCESFALSNAEVKDVPSFYPRRALCADGGSVVERTEQIKTLKDRLL